MSTPTKLAAFAAVLALLLGGGIAAGAAFGPEPRDTQRAASAGDHGGPADEHAGMTGSTAAAAPAAGGHGAPADAVRGLSVAQDGLRVVVDDPELRRGRRQTLTFRIVEDQGRTVRDFDVEHTKRMHLILARRDLTGFQHLHPVQRADGSWSVPVRIDEPGSYRLFADFSHQGRARTLASDLRVDGPADLRALPAPAPTAVSDRGYDVRLDAGNARPGQEATLRFTITKDGQPIHTEPYLGAGGHLVALREGDMAFLHVHPEAPGAHGTTAGAPAHDDAIAFAATFPTEGRYGLFLQFQHQGRVHTVAFTQEVAR